MVKCAAARVNFACGQFNETILRGIERACQEVIDVKLHDQFQLDVFQGGAGTSANMNVNEVIANRALELMGHRKGEYRYCDPHDHGNASQSINDAYPRALHVGMALGNLRLLAEVKSLIASFKGKGKEFNAILKMGRTQLQQDAVPMTLGQEFAAFAETLAREVRALEAVQRVLCEVNMGATAIGTGLNAPVGYANKYESGVIKGARPVRWDASGSIATELGLLGISSDGYASGLAYSINNSGIAVGSENAYDAGGALLGQRAVAWGPDGIAIDLNSLLDANSGWLTIDTAIGISDTNWVTGYGRFDPDGPGGRAEYKRMFLMQIPEPGSLGLSGTLSIFLLRRRSLRSHVC